MDTQQQLGHRILPVATHDERARQEFVRSYKYFLAAEVAPAVKHDYQANVRPGFEQREGRAPKSRHEVRRAMNASEPYRLWSSLLRTSQEMMWSSCIASVGRQLPALIAKAASADGSAGGSLRLDPSLEIPAYHRAVDIHCQPGGYHTENAADDVAAGAIYDRAVYLYAMGRMGVTNEDMGASQAAWLTANHPALAPKRILDLGCAVGHSTLPYRDAYPEAEIHAVDVAAPMLRYAHARAESLGVPVHFSQQNAESMDFEDESFDLIVSHILVHETSAKAIVNIMRECRRLLRPGGLVVHSETPPYKGMDPYDAFILDWDTYNNNEPFWGYSHEIDPPTLAKRSGFDPEKTFEAMAPSVFEAAEARRTNVFQGGDFAGGGLWYLYGFQK